MADCCVLECINSWSISSRNVSNICIWLWSGSSNKSSSNVREKRAACHLIKGKTRGREGERARERKSICIYTSRCVRFHARNAKLEQLFKIYCNSIAFMSFCIIQFNKQYQMVFGRLKSPSLQPLPSKPSPPPSQRYIDGWMGRSGPKQKSIVKWKNFNHTKLCMKKSGGCTCVCPILEDQ